MSEQASRAYEDWRTADTAAREAERRLKGAWVAHEMGGEPPSKQLAEEVSRLRVIANEKLHAAVNALGGTKPGAQAVVVTQTAPTTKRLL